MVMVVSAHNALFFLVVWEIMSLASYFLVIYENKEKENVQAGSLYFIMTHVGTAFIMLAFLLLYRSTGSLDFGVIKETIGHSSPLVANAVFVLALVGFGTKAGIIPFHIWLPNAHPAAPSHVSALMSGVMIKTGIYMFIRMFMDILPDAPLWWGVVILILGAISSLLGVLYALTEYDIKRLLAYSSIENIGIILLGLGSSLVFWSLDMKPLAVLSLVAALFHTLNHAIFKALLFLGAGSVISQTHTRNMEEYGGLIKYMPETALFFLAGSMAISALPPLNGFFSEWMTFQSLFSGIMASNISVRWVFMLAAGSLAFTGGLAAMCFVRAFGITFLARPRSENVRHARESGFALRIGMAVLAVLTIIIGFTAGSITNTVSGVVSGLSAFNSYEPAFFSNIYTVGLRSGFSSISMPLILASLIVTIILTFFAVYLVSRNRKTNESAAPGIAERLSAREWKSPVLASPTLSLLFSAGRSSRLSKRALSTGMKICAIFKNRARLSLDSGYLQQIFLSARAYADLESFRVCEKNPERQYQYVHTVHIGDTHCPAVRFGYVEILCQL